MNAPVRILTHQQITSGAVLDRCLRSAHEIETLLNSTIGTIDFEAKHAVVTEAQRIEARTIAEYLAAHVATLTALANSAQKDAA